MKTIRSDYEMTLKSGMFWEWFPEMTGIWEKDKSAYSKFYRKRAKQQKKNAEIQRLRDSTGA